MKKIYYLFSLGLMAICLAGCEKETKQNEEPFFSLAPQNESGTFEMGPQATSLTDLTGLKVFIYSNQSWNIATEFEDEIEDNSWISIYPSSGNDDGRFYINVTELTCPYPRKCRFVFTNDEGEELYSANFVQNGTEAYLTPDSGLLSFGSEGGELMVSISTNILWEAEVIPEKEGDDVSWCTLTESTEITQKVKATKNTGDFKRSAVVRFSMIGKESVFADVAVTQLPEYKISNATLINISEALKLSGVVEDNYKIQGYVISDMSTDNYEQKNDLFLQDDSQRGIVVKLASPELNTYTPGTKLAVWLTGGIVQKDEDGIIRVYNMTEGNFSTETTLTGSEATPVEIDDLTKIGNYPCSLVKLKGVYFPSPIGTLCNVGVWKSGACGYALTRIVDKNGNIANIRTLTTFTEKFGKGLTSNEYDITGIVLPDKGEYLHIDGDKNVTKQMDGYNFDHSIRVRKISDLSDTGSAPHMSPVVYWLGVNTTNKSYWVPAYGEGEFNLIKGISTATEPNNTSRVSYILKDPNGAAEDANCYKSYSTVTYFDATYGGYFYELSTSTKNCTGKILFSFTLGGWGSAARYMKLQSSSDGATWTDVPGADIELWNCYSTGTSSKSDYTRLYSNQSFAFVIPDGAGKDRLYVRLTTQGKPNKRADGSASAVANTSSLALYYFSFSELK